MAELHHKVETIAVDFQCPVCLTGRLRPIGNVHYTSPLQYPHKCNNPECTYKKTFLKTYPYIDYKEIK